MFAKRLRLPSTLRSYSRMAFRKELEDLDDLKIPTFKEFRQQLKLERLQPKKGSKPAQSHSSNRLMEETRQSLLAAKTSSGLSLNQLDAIRGMLEPSPARSKFLNASPTELALDRSAGNTLVLKIDHGYLSQFGAVQNDSAKNVRLKARAMQLVDAVNADSAAREQNGLEPSLSEIVKVIRLNGILGRTSEAQEAYDLIQSTGAVPSTFAINTLMDAYASKQDYASAVDTFKEFNKGFAEPDVISFSILIKACISSKNLDSAFEVYEAMKIKKIKPTLQIFTSLIKGCIDARDLSRAWKTYNHMREDVHNPDAVTYSLMIHACALDENAERALELFSEMHKSRLVPTEVTYTSLLHALGSRPDYYHEVWSLVDQMIDQGWKINLTSCYLLIRVCASHGDIVKLRKLWNWIICQYAQNGNEQFKPSISLCSSVLYALGQCARVSRRVSAKPKNNQVAEIVSPEIYPITEEIGENITHLVRNPAPQRNVAEPLKSLTLSTVSNHSLSHLHLGNHETNTNAIMSDASTLWNYWITATDSEPITSQLTDSYLSVFCAVPRNHFSASAAVNLYNDMYAPPRRLENQATETGSSPAHKNDDLKQVDKPLNRTDKALVDKTGNTFHLMLDLVTKDKKFMKIYGSKIWNDYLEWDSLREAELMTSAEKNLMTSAEKEALRVKEGRGSQSFRGSFLMMINGFTRIDEITSALDILEQSTIFRNDPSYIYPILFKDVSSLVSKISLLAEGGDLVAAKRLKALCPPPPPKTPQEEVKQMLKNKWSGGNNWWGWESLGIDENVHRKIIRKQKKESDRIKAYWNNKRKK